jgi:hypothetical protein
MTGMAALIINGKNLRLIPPGGTIKSKVSPSLVLDFFRPGEEFTLGKYDFRLAKLAGMLLEEDFVEIDDPMELTSVLFSFYSHFDIAPYALSRCKVRVEENGWLKVICPEDVPKKGCSVMGFTKADRYLVEEAMLKLRGILDSYDDFRVAFYYPKPLEEVSFSQGYIFDLNQVPSALAQFPHGAIESAIRALSQAEDVSATIVGHRDGELTITLSSASMGVVYSPTGNRLFIFDPDSGTVRGYDFLEEQYFPYGTD